MGGRVLVGALDVEMPDGGPRLVHSLDCSHQPVKSSKQEIWGLAISNAAGVAAIVTACGAQWS